MADGYDGDDYLDYDDEWLYVEEDFALADELAESQIANPGYAGTNYEIDAEGYEFDLYDYWADLEYADDALWDNDIGRSRSIAKVEVNQGRGKSQPSNVSKRRARDTVGRRTPGPANYDPICFHSRTEREDLDQKRVRTFAPSFTYALFPDWQERLAANPTFTSDNVIPTAPSLESASESGWEEDGDLDNDVEELADDAGSDMDGLAIDPGMLRTILMERLGDAGLKGVDERIFMQAITNLMSGKNDADEASGELAAGLLENLMSGSGNAALGNWLSSQGISLESAGPDDDADDAIEASPAVQEPDGNGSTRSVDLKQGASSEADAADATAGSVPESDALSQFAGTRQHAATTKKRQAPPVDLDEIQVRETRHREKRGKHG